MLTNLDIVIRLALAMGAGAMVGIEREKTRHPAGMRTYMLVSIGSALITLVSLSMFPEDPTRITAAVISGIGFLGAGTIFRDRNNVRGLTTAASIWVVAGLGVALGAGLYFMAAVGAVAIMLTLYMVNIEKQIEKKGKKR